MGWRKLTVSPGGNHLYCERVLGVVIAFCFPFATMQNEEIKMQSKTEFRTVTIGQQKRVIRKINATYIKMSS